MECLLCEVMQVVMRHLEPCHVNRLLRTCKSIREAVRLYEEWYWSGSRLVKLYRSATVENGARQLRWISDEKEELMEWPCAPISSRGILEKMWEMRKLRNHERSTLFLNCVVWPEFMIRPAPCYLFKTEAAVQWLRQQHSYDLRYHIQNAWPIWIACKRHPYWRGCRCPPTMRFENCETNVDFLRNTIYAAFPPPP